MPKLKKNERALVERFAEVLYLATNFKGKKIQSIYHKKRKEPKEALKYPAEAWMDAQPVLHKILDDSTYIRLKEFVGLLIEQHMKEGRGLYNDLMRMTKEYELLEVRKNDKQKEKSA